MENIGKFIDFIITQKCTYKCPYCSQSKAEAEEKEDADEKTINSFLNLLDKIDKDFEITITGGEAILHPMFYDLILKIKKKSFKINLITNLSFEVEKYKKAFDILDDSLNRFDISFHLDEIKDFNNTLKKLEEIIKIKPQKTKTSFLIPLYNLNDKKEHEIEQIKQIAEKHNIDYHFQYIHFCDKYIKDNSKSNIREYGLNTFSNICFAGSLSAVIYENGESYRCYSSRFLKTNYLGNINNESFSLLNKAKPCVHKYCTCPKPKNYNQITDKKALLKAIAAKAINTICMPYFIFKHFNVVKAKIRQYKNNARNF